jgi:hypothetical protein
MLLVDTNVILDVVEDDPPMGNVVPGTVGAGITPL